MDARRAKHVFVIAQRIQSDAPKPALELQEPAERDLFDRLVTESELADACRQLYRDGHYARAVEEAFKCLNNFVKSRVGSSEDGSSLMKSVFSQNAPKLKLNSFKSKSEKDEQLGYMEIYSGCMTGIRNPRAHEHKHKDEPGATLEMVTWANHLMRRARLATRARKSK